MKKLSQVIDDDMIRISVTRVETYEVRAIRYREAGLECLEDMEPDDEETMDVSVALAGTGELLDDDGEN